MSFEVGLAYLTINFTIQLVIARSPAGRRGNLYSLVIPAKAGIQSMCNLHVPGFPIKLGMTLREIATPRCGGARNDTILCYNPLVGQRKGVIAFVHCSSAISLLYPLLSTQKAVSGLLKFLAQATHWSSVSKQQTPDKLVASS